ncbi:hypothetical protein COX59_04425, partial [Candidatus Beckwithbacteria bacterium CG_4_10_14_0_2_um_filter_47_25]|uniref:AAA+ ATPase domain-containing protein n=3 Tax=Candidatus Beckwithiibacteriota TaxID=1752726 RepID=A0A1J4RML9_9BACT
MFKRNLEKELIDWKKNPAAKPLILRGARQVGKTSLVRKFAGEQFEEIVEINLEKKDIRQMFTGVLSLADFYQRAEILLGRRIIAGKNLLFLDEIQALPELLSLLRFFAEERPDQKVIAAGSLLEAKITGDWSVPVGRVEYAYLYPLTFFEYLEAVGQGKLRSYLAGVGLGESVSGNSSIRDHFRRYLIVGGMPEAVAGFAKNNSLIPVQAVHNRLLTAFGEDIGKYAREAERKYLELVMETAPKLAGGLYKYENFGGSAYRGREIAGAINLLENVRLLREVPAVNSVILPLNYKYKRPKKMIWLDTGMVNFSNKMQADFLQGECRGRVMEQFTGQTLIAGGGRRPFELGYWARNRDEGSAEVDFCFQFRDKLVGLEVKSGTIRGMKSLFSLIKLAKGRVIPVRTSWDDLKMETYHYNGKTYRIVSLPFYLLERWEEFL